MTYLRFIFINIFLFSLFYCTSLKADLKGSFIINDLSTKILIYAKNYKPRRVYEKVKFINYLKFFTQTHLPDSQMISFMLFERKYGTISFVINIDHKEYYFVFKKRGNKIELSDIYTYRVDAKWLYQESLLIKQNGKALIISKQNKLQLLQKNEAKLSNLRIEIEKLNLQKLKIANDCEKLKSNNGFLGNLSKVVIKMKYRGKQLDNELLRLEAELDRLRQEEFRLSGYSQFLLTGRSSYYEAS